jgi:hypothetical protein
LLLISHLKLYTHLLHFHESDSPAFKMRFTIATVLACTFFHHMPCASTLTYRIVATLSFAQITPNVAGAKNVGAGSGAQFITGGCVSNADCE